jgi:hypothetical protein
MKTAAKASKKLSKKIDKKLRFEVSFHGPQECKLSLKKKFKYRVYNERRKFGKFSPTHTYRRFFI